MVVAVCCQGPRPANLHKWGLATFLWLWPATDHEPHCRWTEYTPPSGWWRSHTAGIYSDCSTHKITISAERLLLMLHARHDSDSTLDQTESSRSWNYHSNSREKNMPTNGSQAFQTTVQKQYLGKSVGPLRKIFLKPFSFMHIRQ